MGRRHRINYQGGDVVVSKYDGRRMLVTSLSPDGFMAGVWIGNVGQPEFAGARERAARCLAGIDVTFGCYDATAFVNESPAERDLFEQVRA